jgi:hypothetical protein
VAGFEKHSGLFWISCGFQKAEPKHQKYRGNHDEKEEGNEAWVAKNEIRDSRQSRQSYGRPDYQ